MSTRNRQPSAAVVAVVALQLWQARMHESVWPACLAYRACTCVGICNVAMAPAELCTMQLAPCASSKLQLLVLQLLTSS